MSAAIASRRRPSRMASAMYGSSSTISTRTLRCYEPRISSAYRKPHTCRQHRAALTGSVTYSQPARTPARPVRTRRIRAAGLLVVVAAIAGLGHQWPASSSSTAAPSIHVLPHEHPGPFGEIDRAVPHRRLGGLGAADGAVPDGTTVFDDEVPGVAKLDSGLLAALRRAATDAAGDGVELYVESGWRSPEYQEQLLREAISKYGSEAAATRWVATPETSAHVSGDAADMGPAGASARLSAPGAAYGLCQIYGNEPWHFELRPGAIGHRCPAVYADPTHDPRMQQR